PFSIQACRRLRLCRGSRPARTLSSLSGSAVTARRNSSTSPASSASSATEGAGIGVTPSSFFVSWSGIRVRSYNSPRMLTPRIPHVTSTSSTALQRLRHAALVLSVAALVAACGSIKPEKDPTAGWPAERLYSDAREAMAAGSWNTARERLEAIEARYPFGVHAQQSLIDQAYVNWKDDEPEQALAAIDRFEQQYPNHPGSDYMLYLKGLITFTPASLIYNSLTGQDPAERDPKGLRESYES